MYIKDLKLINLSQYRYRIRQLTEKEEDMEVSKDVKKVRAFEQTLLASYQTYLTDLELLSKSTILP